MLLSMPLLTYTVQGPRTSLGINAITKNPGITNLPLYVEPISISNLCFFKVILLMYTVYSGLFHYIENISPILLIFIMVTSVLCILYNVDVSIVMSVIMTFFNSSNYCSY